VYGNGSYVGTGDANYYVLTYLGGNYEDSSGCDYYTLYVYDGPTRAYQGYVRYHHAYTVWVGAYTQEYPGNIANWHDGWMSDDTNCGGGFTAKHVHEMSSGQDALNPDYDKFSTSTCVPGVRVCRNNDLTNFTRKFIW
jgi:hypothetical protein